VTNESKNPHLSARQSNYLICALVFFELGFAVYKSHHILHDDRNVAHGFECLLLLLPVDYIPQGKDAGMVVELESVFNSDVTRRRKDIGTERFYERSIGAAAECGNLQCEC